METLVPLNLQVLAETPVSKFIGSMIESVGAVHAMHLTTTLWARHKALDAYYKDMPELIDSFAESYIARHTVSLTPKIVFPYTTAEDLLIKLREEGYAIHTGLSPDLSNPLEDILTLISSTLYKLRFT